MFALRTERPPLRIQRRLFLLLKKIFTSNPSVPKVMGRPIQKVPTFTSCQTSSFSPSNIQDKREKKKYLESRGVCDNVGRWSLPHFKSRLNLKSTMGIIDISWGNLSGGIMGKNKQVKSDLI